MNWEPVCNILFGLGLLAVVIGLLLRFQAGRWLLGAILLILSLVALLHGEWSSADDSFGNADPLRASRYWLYGGTVSLAAALAAIFLKY